MDDRTRLAGQRILISGGTSGIGRATVDLLAQHGARILTFGRDPDSLADVTATGGAVDGLIADVTAREGIDAIFAAVDERLGGIDILIANAAIAAEPIHEMDEDGWRAVVDTNLTGYLALARGAIHRMAAQGRGQLVFVGSISTEIKASGESVYAATKAGVQAFAETLRKEVADKGIRVSVVQPGSVATPMQECSADEKRAAIANAEMLYAEEIAEAIAFVLTRSERADVVNLRIEPRNQKTS